jgi:hypothetical protein
VSWVVARSYLGPGNQHTVDHAFLISTGAVTLAEIGDKTQLLSLVLAARYRKPIPIILGVLTATLVNHACAGALGAWLGTLLTPTIMRWALAASFIAMGLWILVPDKLDDEEANTSRTHFGVFGATVVTFFLAEMGDKTDRDYRPRRALSRFLRCGGRHDARHDDRERARDPARGPLRPPASD